MNGKREMGRKKVIYRTVGCVRKREKNKFGKRERGRRGEIERRRKVLKKGGGK